MLQNLWFVAKVRFMPMSQPRLPCNTNSNFLGNGTSAIDAQGSVAENINEYEPGPVTYSA